MSDDRLPRRIGLVGAIVLSFNGAVAASIFALPATLAGDFGAFSPLMFPVVAFAALLIIIPFCWSASAFTQSGGPAAYGAVFGRFVGFELGWIYYVARTAAFAANANVLTDYTARWIAGAAEGLLRAAILIAVTVLFAAVNIAGVRRSIGLLTGLTVLKAVPLFIAAAVAIALTYPWPAPEPVPTLTEFETGLLIVLYAFVGFEQVVVPAGLALVPLPPYSPELNGSERIWGFLRSHYLSNRVYKDYDALFEAHRIPRQLEVHDDRLLTAAAEHARQRLGVARVDLLVRHVRRHVNEIARARLGDEFQTLAPAHASPAAHDVNDAFQCAVVVRSGLGVGVDRHGSGPELSRASSGVINGGRPRHAGGLRRIEIQLRAGDHLDPVLAPVGRGVQAHLLPPL